jgi:hypothetical protein
MMLKLRVLILSIMLAAPPCFSSDTWRLPNGKAAVFLNSEKGYDYIQNSDFINGLTALDVSLRMKKDFVQNDSLDYQAEYLTFLRDQIKNWSWCDRRYLKKRLAKASAVLDSIAPAVIPDTLFLIRTTGDQEFNAFYTVKNAIVFPGLVRTTSTLFPWIRCFSRYIEYKLIHELYHIFSRYHPEIRHNVYTLFGFDRVEKLNLHDNVLNNLITNPDDHDQNYKISVQDSGSNACTDYRLLILSKYHTWVGYTDFSARINVLIEYLDPKLHPIELKDGAWNSILNDEGQPRLVDVSAVPAFADKIELNLMETISAEEIAAKSFVILIKTETKKKERSKRKQAELGRLQKFKIILNN